MDIKDKVIVITGAGRGLGRAIALALGAQGATLALLDINRADLEATSAMVHSQNDQCDQDSQCELFVCNVASEAEVEAAFAAIKGRFGVLHGLINCAGNIGQSNYAASKAGVASLVVTWARELARHGIRVMGIAPGVFATDMTAAMKPEAMARMQQAIPVGTLGEAQQLAETVSFIFANDYLSGRMIELDGGLRL